jgi:hypothetical protein
VKEEQGSSSSSSSSNNNNNNNNKKKVSGERRRTAAAGAPWGDESHGATNPAVLYVSLPVLQLHCQTSNRTVCTPYALRGHWYRYASTPVCVVLVRHHQFLSSNSKSSRRVIFLHFASNFQKPNGPLVVVLRRRPWDFVSRAPPLPLHPRRPTIPSRAASNQRRRQQQAAAAAAAAAREIEARACARASKRRKEADDKRQEDKVC